jgi:hypothetical protein
VKILIALNNLLQSIRSGSPIVRDQLKGGRDVEIPFSPQPFQVCDKMENGIQINTSEFQISLSRIRRKGIKIFLEHTQPLNPPPLKDAAKKLGLKIEHEEDLPDKMSLLFSTNVLMEQLDDIFDYADSIIEQLKKYT